MKKTRRRKSLRPDAATLCDEALNRCLNILALAGLLEGCQAEMNPPTITRAGLLIFEEAEALHQGLQRLAALEK